MYKKQLAELLDTIKTKGRLVDLKRIKKAFEFAKQVHEGEKRFSGKDYILHPIAVAKLVTEVDFDESMIMAALMHDVLKDKEENYEILKAEFGEELAKIVSRVNRIHIVENFVPEKQAESLKNMFLSMAKDVRIMYIKLADRLHTMQTIKHRPALSQQIIASETLSIYVPIARRLGVYYFKDELEEICFKILQKPEWQALSKKIREYNKNKNLIVDIGKEKIKEMLQDSEIFYHDLSSRIKQKYSIYRKMQERHEENLENIYDFYAIRIITDTIESCYQILGLIHKNWTPLNHRIKDYIAVPKPNGYQSLHTTVLGLGQDGSEYKPVEIQIRTKKMHYIAEKGTAAHWQYKDSNSKKDWLKNLSDIASEISDDNEEFISQIKKDPLKSRIYVLTPKGDIKDLPEGATPIDFAYSIHSDIGHHVSMAKINAKIAPLDSVLKNGDIVEIKTDKNRSPNPEWINIVCSAQAKSAIKSWLKKQTKENIIKIGREELNRQLSKIDKEALDTNYSILKNYKGKDLSLKDRENIICQIGEGNSKATDIIKHIFVKTGKKSKDKESTSKEILNYTKKVLVLGDDSISTKIASCCAPTYKDEIVGYVTRGKHVSIHKKQCAFVKSRAESRLVECKWQTITDIRIEFNIRGNKQKNSAAIVDIVSEDCKQIDSIDYQSDENNSIMIIKGSIAEINNLANILEKIKKLNGVSEVNYKIIDSD